MRPRTHAELVANLDRVPSAILSELRRLGLAVVPVDVPPEVQAANRRRTLRNYRRLVEELRLDRPPRDERRTCIV